MIVELKFEGGQDIARVLNSMVDEVRRQTSLEALLAAAQPIAAHAASICRRGEQGPPHLADNINVKPLKKTAEGGFDEWTVGIGAPKEFFYDYFLEYGTRRTQAYPFYRPALDAEVPNALVICKAAYWQAILKYAPGTVVP